VRRTALLDVNVLVALFDPDHVHHEIAHDWFAEEGRDGWSTCPLTEAGFIRVLSNA
jgi:predicted nucleic acid-binding protein